MTALLLPARRRLAAAMVLASIGCGPAPSQPPASPSPIPAAESPAAGPSSTTRPSDPTPPQPQPPNSTPQPQSPAPPARNPASSGELLQPQDLAYLGAIALPIETKKSSWEYSGSAMTYFPGGDPQGPSDAHPGSLFLLGHDHQQMVSEISIPAPVISLQHRIEDLPRAATLQPFADIRSGLFGDLEIPRAGIEYLPSRTSAGRLHFCWGQHFEWERAPSHGSSALHLQRPDTHGLWRIGDFTNYVLNDYLFEIPESWSEQNLPGYRLATGRFRDGQWGGLGPALVAYAPPDDASPPPAGAVIERAKVLLMYGRPLAGAAELEVDPSHQLTDFSEADDWTGGAWLTAGDRHAVVLIGVKALGKTWYGFSNGLEYPISGDPDEQPPEPPPFPHDQRGWWSERIEARMLFFDPDQLAAVAAGRLESWAPQPYASLNLDAHLWDAGFDYPRYKRDSLGACAFDRERGLIYVVERRAPQDDERSLIHVFRIR